MTHPALEQIRNFYALEDNVATGGQPAPDQIPAIRMAGFDVVINLSLPDSPDAIREEDKLIHELGMVYEHIPVDFKRPSLEDLKLFFHKMECHRGRNIFVHCAYNWRVSSFMFLYRVIKSGRPIAEARSDLHRIWQPDQTWQSFIESALDHYQIER